MNENSTRPTLPKYRQIADTIRAEIASSAYAEGDKLPNDLDLAKRFGISRLTIIRALRLLEVDGLVERRAGSGTYVGVSSSSTSHAFGLLIPDLGQGEIFEPICQGMARAGSAFRQALLWGDSAVKDGDKEQRALELCRFYITHKVAGVFFAPLELSSHQDQVNSQILALLEEARIPVVLLDRNVGHCWEAARHDLVGIDNWRAGFVMAKHLLDQGCHRLGFFLRPGSAPTIEARIAGVYEAARRQKSEFSEISVLAADPSDKAGVQRWLDVVRADGVLCANDYTAGQLMRTILDLGFSIPDDIRLVGFDDVRYASLLPVPLTTLRQPCLEIGDAAMKAMIARLESPLMATRVISLDGELIVRDSTVTRDES